MGGKGKKRRVPESAGAEGPISKLAPCFWVFSAGTCHRSLLQLQLATVRQVRCGERLLALVLNDGRVTVYDTQAGGELQVRKRKPKCIDLQKNKIHSMDFGETQMLLLSYDGKLFEHCYQGSGKQSPKRVLLDKQIVQVACGDHHSMALSREGELYAWGKNAYGQLGLRHKPFNQSPQLVEHLREIPLAQIAAGSAHSFAVSLSGAVYSWGKNSNGQLGLGHTEKQHLPTFIETLEHRKSVFVSCGEDHTAVLTKDGLVYTFGFGAHGQLGHNCTKDEHYPRLVTSLFGVRVSQVTCGSNHTVVYVPSLQKVYSFGNGKNGQIGYKQKCNRLTPLPMTLPEHVNHPENSTSEPSCVYEIVAGGNQTAVFYLYKKNDDPEKSRIATVDVDMADKWLADWDSDGQKIKTDINDIFSSVACVNGSFLDQRKDKHFKTSEKMSGVDMSSVYLFFEKITKNPRILKQVGTAVQKLLRSLDPSLLTAEAFRVFLIVPEFLRVQPSWRSEFRITKLFAEAVQKLTKEKLQILDSLWTMLPATVFSVLVDVFRKASMCLLFDALAYKVNAVIDMKKTLFVLSVLSQVNSRSGFKVQESKFYISGLEPLWHIEYADTDKYYITQNVLYVLMKYPCILNMQLKVEAFNADCGDCQLQGNLLADANYLMVSRKQLVRDTWQQIQSDESSLVYECALAVHFKDEPGIDRGGLSQEFFTVISRELCSPVANVFKYYDESCLVWFPSEVSGPDNTFYCIGILLGMALYNNCVAHFPFPLALYKKLLDVEPTLEDLKELSPTAGRTLQSLIDEQYDDIIESLCLDFTIIAEVKGCPLYKELVENGSQIQVLKYNRKQYVDAYVKNVFSTSVEKQFNEFFRGFYTGCPSTTWRLFLPEELMAVINGNTEYDWEQIQQNTKYEGYEESDDVIKNFWETFHELPEEEKKHFLAYITGSVRIPVEGMDKLPLTICEMRCDEDAELYYPVAATCSHSLILPRYSNPQTLKERFRHALKSYERFSTA